MIEIINFRVEQNNPLSIEVDTNRELLLTSGRNILRNGDAQNGGLAINFDIKVVEESISRGVIAIVQICNYHHLRVWDNDSNQLKNDLINHDSGLVLDGMNRHSPFYKQHAIENNRLNAYVRYLNRYLYYDAPYVYLEEEWSKVEYKIDFNTIICYAITQNANCQFTKIQEFEWYINAEIIKERNDWRIIQNTFSSTDTILESIRSENAIFDPTGFVNLKQALNP